MCYIHTVPGDKFNVCKYLTYNSTEHGRSWEANNSSASEEILYILWHPTLHYYVPNSPPFVPVPSQINPIHVLTSISWRRILILSSHVFRAVSFFQESPPKSCTNLSSSPCRPHALPTSFSFILSPEGYLVTSTNLETPHYAFSAVSYYFLPLRHKCLPQQPILEYLPSMCFF